MQNRKKLLFNKPIISYEPVVDHVTGIINANFDKYECVLYNNFIDIVIDVSADFDGSRNWLNYNMFEFYKYPHEMVFEMTREELINQICEWIDNECYVLVSLETYYVSNYFTYKEKKFRHYAMIQGYDKEKQVFYCGDFFDFEFYTVQECLMKEIVKGIVKNSEVKSDGPAKDFTLLHVNINSLPKIDINKIISSLDKFAAEYNLLCERKYGMAIFDHICLMIEEGKVLLHTNEFKRHAQIIFCHMEVMVLRIAYFQRIWNIDLSGLVGAVRKEQKGIELYRNYILKLIMSGSINFPDNKKQLYINKIKCIKNNYINLIKIFKECLILGSK